MSRLQKICTHITVILSLMFAVFLVLDQFNPLMNFIDNDISRWLLAALCLSVVAQAALQRIRAGRGEGR